MAEATPSFDEGIIMWKKFKTVIVRIFLRYQTKMRFSMSVNSLIMLLTGGGIGALCALMVLTMNDILDSPWSYLCTIAIPFLVKMAIMWFGTLVVVPSIRDITSEIVENQTGITVDKNQPPSVNITGNVLILPAAAAIAVTIYLYGLNSTSDSAIGNGLMYYIAILVGAVVSFTENLSNPTVIKAIWHNRADFQESPLFKQTQGRNLEDGDSSTDNNPGAPSTNRHSYPLTRAQRRRATRNHRAGGW